jgi:CheY-like chemotaxis protein
MPCVLIVEDHDDTREMVAFALEQAGYQVATAWNGHEGLKQLHACRPGLILLDLMMPVMDGWRFRAEQGRLDDPMLAGVPVVLLTAVPDATRHAKALNANGVVPKPINVDALLDAIGQHVLPEVV